jgi:hypothetical protein
LQNLSTMKILDSILYRALFVWFLPVTPPRTNLYKDLHWEEIASGKNDVQHLRHNLICWPVPVVPHVPNPNDAGSMPFYKDENITTYITQRLLFSESICRQHGPLEMTNRGKDSRVLRSFKSTSITFFSFKATVNPLESQGRKLFPRPIEVSVERFVI